MVDIARRAKQHAIKRTAQANELRINSRSSLAFMTTDTPIVNDAIRDAFANRANDGASGVIVARDFWTRESAKANTRTINHQETQWDTAQRRSFNALRNDEYRRINAMERLQRRIELRHEQDADGYVLPLRERKTRTIKLSATVAPTTPKVTQAQARKLRRDRDYAARMALRESGGLNADARTTGRAAE